MPFNAAYTVEPRNNSPAFEGFPSIKVPNDSFNVISPLFKGYPEIKVKIFSPNGTDEAGSYCISFASCEVHRTCFH